MTRIAATFVSPSLVATLRNCLPDLQFFKFQELLFLITYFLKKVVKKLSRTNQFRLWGAEASCCHPELRERTEAEPFACGP